MPVVYGNYTKQLKLLPLTLHSDGSAIVSVRYGFTDELGNFEAATEKSVFIGEEGVSAILDSEGIAGLTRRDDLSFAVYTYLVTNGYIEAGTIS
jgi:hypothetical protein